MGAENSIASPQDDEPFGRLTQARRIHMRASVKKSIALSVGAMTLGFGIFAAATPAAAHPWPHHGFHGGFFAGALGLGLLGGMVASQYGDDSCVQYRPTYDRWGNYIGRRAVDACD
jgi:hypothetical protein